VLAASPEIKRFPAQPRDTSELQGYNSSQNEIFIQEAVPIRNANGGLACAPCPNDAVNPAVMQNFPSS